WGKLRGLALVDGGPGHTDLLSLGVGQDEHLALLAQQEARDHLTILESEDGGPERLVDVAIRVEDILRKAVEPAAADAIELRSDPRALAAELVANPAVLLVHRHARLGRMGRGAESGPPTIDEFVELLVGRRETGEQRLEPLLQPPGFRLPQREGNALIL